MFFRALLDDPDAIPSPASIKAMFAADLRSSAKRERASLIDSRSALNASSSTPNRFCIARKSASDIPCGLTIPAPAPSLATATGGRALAIFSSDWAGVKPGALRSAISARSNLRKSAPVMGAPAGTGAAGLIAPNPVDTDDGASAPTV